MVLCDNWRQIMSILKTIKENHGEIGEVDLINLAKEFPEMPVVIKWSRSPRSVHPANTVAGIIQDAEANGDFAREVFLSVQTMEAIQ